MCYNEYMVITMNNKNVQLKRNTAKGLKIEEKISNQIKLKGFTDISKNKLYIFLKKQNIDYKSIISRKLIPDKAFINLKKKQVIIYEIKYQETPGSVDEKLQTCDFKIKQYEKLFKKIGITDIKYIYELNNWFTKPEYKDVLDYIKSIEGCSYHFYN